MSSATAYPLAWPVGWTRTRPSARGHARYKVSQERAQRDLLDSLRLLGARDVVISTMIELRRDGLPYVNRRNPEDPGVAVYWTRRGKPEVIACDAWLTIGENVRAVYMAVEALRALERCGASEILGRAFQGFSALPPATHVKPWRDVLRFGSEDRPDAEAVNARYRALSLRAHPDNGGSHEAMLELNAARDAALQEVAGQ